MTAAGVKAAPMGPRKEQNGPLGNTGKSVDRIFPKMTESRRKNH